MPIHIQWYTPDKMILLCQFTGIISIEDVRDILIRRDEFLDTIAYRIPVIMDFQAATSSSIGLLSKIGAELNRPSHPNEAMNIRVGLNPLLKTLAHIIQRLYPRYYGTRQIHYVSTMLEAEAIIRAYFAQSAP